MTLKPKQICYLLLLLFLGSTLSLSAQNPFKNLGKNMKEKAKRSIEARTGLDLDKNKQTKRPAHSNNLEAKDPSSISVLPAPEFSPSTPVMLTSFTSEPDAVHSNGMKKRSLVHDLTVVENRLFFSAYGRKHGKELWISDGTDTGTRMVKDINKGDNWKGPNMLREGDGELLFKGEDPALGETFWRSNGTEDGTYIVRQRNSNSFSAPFFKQKLAGDIYIIEDQAIYLEDSETKILTLVKQFDQTYYQKFTARQFQTFGEGFIFQISYKWREDNTIHSESELWISDGTPLGTRQVEEINPKDILHISSKRQVIYHTIKTKYDRDEIGLYSLHALRIEGGIITDTEILRYDEIRGSFIETKSYDVFSVCIDKQVRFSSSKVTGGIYRSDGTPSGTQNFKPSTGECRSSEKIGPYTKELTDHLFFLGFSPEFGTELWTSDLTAAGTQMVKDILPGRGHGIWRDFRHKYISSGDHSVLLNGKLYFFASDSEYGNELWVSDGTEAGTHLVMDICPGKKDSEIRELTVLGNGIFFVADDGLHGKQLWKYVP